MRGYGTNNPPLTVTYSGFATGDVASVLSGSPTLSTAADTNSPIGTYAITVSQGTLSNAHYNFVFTNGTLTVTQTALSIIADNQTRFYGATNPEFTGAILGIQNGDVI